MVVVVVVKEDKKLSQRKLNPITDLESTNEALSNETNPISVVQFILEILVKQGEL